MTLDQSWFTEPVEATGTAFSLKGRKLHEEQTPYQKIEIWQTDENGIYLHPNDPAVAERDAAFQGYGVLPRRPIIIPQKRNLAVSCRRLGL